MANNKDRDLDASLGDQNTLQGQPKPEIEDRETRSLGDQATFAGGRAPANPKSLGDQVTFGGGADQGDFEDDDMEIVDLAARYKVEKTLGKGGMGEVLLATDTRLDRKVAIKRILGDAARSKTAVNRFLTEAKSIAALNHPNVVQIYDYGRATDGPFLIMEFVEGNSLLDRCHDGALPLEDAVELACQLCDGLGRAHEAGIIHRDIKPANVLMTTDGIPKLTDFGLAKAESADTGMTMAGAVLGTLDFMPPEQRRDAALTDARSDLWSLAATLYQMVTGKSPKIIKFNDVPKALQEVLGKALEDRKEDRYQSAKELKQALKQSLAAGTEVDLELGACPQCGTKNETNRKFCKKCAQSLEVPCLSCSSKIPMWEEVCGQCGTKQSALVDQRKQAMAQQRDQAEQLLERLEFQKASQLATLLGDETDLRLQHLKSWSQKFLQQVEKRTREELARLSELVGEALKHEQAFDYPSAINTLDQVPSALRNQAIETFKGMTAAKLLKRVQTKHQEAQKLEKLIQQRVSSRDVNGLQAEVDKFLELCPNHTAMLKLKQQLVDREAKLVATRDEAYAAAKKLIDALDFAGVVRELERIDPYVMQPAIAHLKEEAANALARLQTLQKSIAKAVEQKQYHGLLAQVNELLELKPDDAAMKSLQTQLIARDEKNAAQISEIVARAQGLMTTCRFDQATKELSRIPKELQTSEVIEMLQICELVSFMRQSAMQSLAKGLASENYQPALLHVQDYRRRISSERWTDTEFESQFKACQQALANEQEATAAAARNRKLMKQLAMGAAAMLVLVLLVASGMWAKSMIRAYAFTNAMESQRWDDALAIEPNNTKALIARAESLLNKVPPEFEDAIQDLRRAEEIDGDLRIIRIPKAKAYALRAQKNLDSGKTAEAESDIAEAIKLGVTIDYQASILERISAAYAKQAEALAASGKTTQASDILAKALQYDKSVSVPNALLIAYAEDAVKAFEQSDNDANLTAALAAIEKLQGDAAGSDRISGFKQRIAKVCLERGQRGMSSDPTQAAADIKLAEQLGMQGEDVSSMKSALAPVLLAKVRQSLDQNQIEKALVDYATLSWADPEAASQLSTDIFKKTTPEMLSKLPSEILSNLPSELVMRLPAITNSIGMRLKLLPAGNFTMGEGSEAHQVTLTKPFYLGIYEVTQEEYERVMGTNPSYFKGARNPVEQVSWEEAVEFCRKLSAKPEERAAGRVYRLPTEAEWEYACRAGSTTKYCFGDNESQLGEYAWFTSRQTHPVGEKKPNAWGLYDMHGNIFEWCSDRYGDYPKGAVSDPTGSKEGSYRVRRGGSWHFGAADCRSGYRGRYSPVDRVNSLGFRVALVPVASAELKTSTGAGGQE